MNLQFVSDLHIEFRGLNFKNLFQISGDVLCMAGDICACANPADFKLFIEFLKYITPKYQYVLHIAGNHEFYSAGIKHATDINTMQYVNKALKGLNKIFPNYFYLNCETVLLTINKKRYLFAGCTLWTKITAKEAPEVQKSMNDYRHIYVKDAGEIRRFTVADTQKLHTKHLKFIKTALAEHAKSRIPIILLTHHKPVNDAPETKRDALTCAYESDAYRWITPQIKVAIHGHSHQHYDKTLNKTMYVSNPLGYIEQKTGFKKKWIIQL